MMSRVEEYNEFGYSVVRGLVPKASLTVLKDEVLVALQAVREHPNYANFKTGKYREFAFDLHLKSRPIVDFLRSDPIADINASLLGHDIDLRFTSSMTKTKERNCALDWHQDAGYARDPEHSMFSYWIALTDSTKANGCLRIIPGSHKGGLVKHIPSRQFPPDLEIETVDEAEAIDLEMEAGDAVLLSPFVFHSSWPNLSGDIRVALLAGFMKPKPKYLEFELKGSFKYLRNGVPQWAKVEDAQ